MEIIAIVVLWLLVVSSGVLVGGAVFDTVVLQPMWSAAPPLSVTAWPHGAIQSRFFQVVTPGWALLSLVAFALSYALPEAARPWARTAGVVGVVVLVWTVAYFVPRVIRTAGRAGAGLTTDEITRLTRQFVQWGYLRTAIALGAWLVALRALVLASRGS